MLHPYNQTLIGKFIPKENAFYIVDLMIFVHLMSETIPEYFTVLLTED